MIENNFIEKNFNVKYKRYLQKFSALPEITDADLVLFLYTMYINYQYNLF